MKKKEFKIIAGVIVFLFISIAIYLVLDNRKSTFSQIISIPDERFADLNFYNCVKEAVGNDAIDSEGIIDNNALESLTSLNCSGKEIAFSDGLELMVGLKELDLSNNYLYTINIDSNNELRVLHIEQNVLTSIKIRQNTSLVALYANDNPSLIFSSPTYNNINIKVLHLQNTSVGNNTNLNNHLEHMPELVELVINSANIESLNTSNNSNLKYLDASNNNITNIDLTYNVNLEDARLSDNKLSEIEVYRDGNNNGNLKRLYLNNNLLTSFTETTNVVNIGLEELYVEDNQITNIDMAYLNSNKLNQLWARGNRLNSISNTSTACKYTNNCNIGSHIISFNTNDGLKGFNMNVDRVLKMPIPTKEGYTFVGWYKDQSLTEKFEDYDNIEEDITLYAKWNNNGTSEPLPESSTTGNQDVGRVSESLQNSAKILNKSSSSKNTGKRDTAGDTLNEDDYEDEEYLDEDDYEDNVENSKTGDSIYITIILAIGMIVIGYYYAKKLKENN